MPFRHLRHCCILVEKPPTARLPPPGNVREKEPNAYKSKVVLVSQIGQPNWADQDANHCANQETGQLVDQTTHSAIFPFVSRDLF
ncbi:hypothetical protein Nepgr_032618 [Nepenthes gracilis]|uniref:Uncharacterized protein n=1 Tax=Nepenthes gracilis TaxID=150966 RepID=A0AAD3TJQ3_NEPGR|nr:hypothetical protein Nepgr_032618 [Nepenthes gracilis]